MLDSTIGSLLKLSVIIQKTSRKAKSEKISKLSLNTELYNAEEMFEFFPYAKNKKLLKKLSKASIKRHQWLTLHGKFTGEKSLLRSLPPYNKRDKLKQIDTSPINFRSKFSLSNPFKSKKKKIQDWNPISNLQPMMAYRAQEPGGSETMSLGRYLQCYLCQKSIYINSYNTWK